MWKREERRRVKWWHYAFSQGVTLCTSSSMEKSIEALTGEADSWLTGVAIIGRAKAGVDSSVT